MMNVVLAIAAMLFVSAPLSAWGVCPTTPSDSCTAGIIGASVTAQCDIVCDQDPCEPVSFAVCDQCGAGLDGASPDGYCTICNDDTGRQIVGTMGPDVICSGNGPDDISGLADADSISAGGGDDFVDGGDGDDALSGGSGSDTVLGQGGADFIALGPEGTFADGGDGDDTIWGRDGDDTILGGAGNDMLVGFGGADYYDGGSGDDVLSTVLFGATSTPDGILGKRFCGVDGDDTIFARGPARLCVDAGAGTDDFCSYRFFVRGRHPDRFDAATAIGCEDKEDFSRRYVDCGCPY